MRRSKVFLDLASKGLRIERFGDIAAETRGQDFLAVTHHGQRCHRDDGNSLALGLAS